MNSVEDDLHFNRIGLPDADATNWRTRAEYFIGEEEVEYKGFRIVEGKYPIVTITAKDKETLDKVYDKVIAYSDSLETV
jgi:hypothetical protein